jgi:hypothetical protein
LIIMKSAILICFFVVMTMLFIGSKSSNVNDYKIYEEEYTAYNKENDPFKVKYAQISGLGNESLEGQINQILKLSMTEWINEESEWAEKFQFEVKYKTSKYLSLCYTIEWKDPRGEDYLSNYTRIGVTIDMQTGERVYLDDLIKDTDSLMQKLEDYNYEDGDLPPIDSEEADKILHYASISEKEYFEERSKTDPHVNYYWVSYLREKSTFYLSDNKLVITRDAYDMNDVYIDFKQ